MPRWPTPCRRRSSWAAPTSPATIAPSTRASSPSSPPTTGPNERSPLVIARGRSWRRWHEQRRERPFPRPAGEPDPPAHARGLALPLRGLLQAVAAGLEPGRRPAGGVDLGRIPPRGQRALRLALPSPGRRPVDRPPRSPRRGGADLRRPLAHPRTVQPGRLRGRARAPRPVLRLADPDRGRPPAGHGGRVPLREQEPDRGGRG